MPAVAPAAAPAVVAVVGAGVVGCAVAYHLARAAGSSVTTLLLEPHAPAVAVGATSRSAGCVIAASASSEKCHLSAQTLADVSALQQQLGTHLGYRRCGSLRLATDGEDLEALRRYAHVTAKALGGTGATVLGRAEAERKVSWLRCSPENVAGALWVESDGVMDPTVLAGAYLRAARSLGVVEMRPVMASSFALDGGGRVIGVIPASGEIIPCDHVVNAAGAWANLLVSDLGDLPGLPMAPTRSHYWLSQSSPSHFDGADPIVIMPGTRAYTRPEGPHKCLLGLQEAVSPTWDSRQLPPPSAHPSFCADMVGADEVQAQDALLAQFEKLCEFFPSATEIGWGEYTAGLSTYTVDGDYLVGALPGVRGLSVATGCNGSMLSSAGGVGRIIATQVMQSLDINMQAKTSSKHYDGLGGTLPCYDADYSNVLAALGASRYAPGRFLEREPYADVYAEEFRAKCAARRGAKFRN